MLMVQVGGHMTPDKQQAEEPRWEYCELWLDGVAAHDTLGRGKVSYSYECYVIYSGHDGNGKTQSLAELGNVLPYHPWRRAMGLLGGAGWELVSVQHSSPGNLRTQNKVAFFKRRVIQGRRVDEPRLVLRRY
jgi:hypothetical protein